jgi:hypothetical protein
LRIPGLVITRFKLSPGETLIGVIVGNESFVERMPDVFVQALRRVRQS